jgi:hypothetical protein
MDSVAGGYNGDSFFDIKIPFSANKRQKKKEDNSNGT